MGFRKLFFAALLTLSASQVLATGEIQNLITAADRDRLDKYDEIRKIALSEAGIGDAADIAVLENVLGKPSLTFNDFDMTGDWQCRTIKVGGLSPLVVYGWFKCRVTDDGSGWMLEKTSGSQRTKGRFFTDNDKRLTYLGSFFVNDETPKPYGNGSQTDQVGYAFRGGPKEWRIEFPSPHYESKLDILEFRR